MPFGLGQSSQLGIGIAIRLDNRFSGEAAKVNQQLMAMRKNANSAVSGAIRDYRNQAVSIALAAGAASLGMFKMAEAGSQYSHAINQIFIVGGRELGRTRKQLDGFAQSLSKTFNRDPLEIGGAMFENVKQGVRGGLEEITKYQVAVATATDETLSGPNGVAANLLNIMNAMDIPQSRFKDVANAVTAVANATQSSVYDLGEAMQYGAFTAHQFNLPMTTTLALFGKLSQVGIRGSSAGTGVNNMLTQMAKGLGPFQTKSQLAAWQMMGLDPKQIRDMADSGNMTGVIKAVSDATASMTPTQKGSIIPKAFNIRGTRAIEGLFDSKNGNKTIGSILAEAEAGVKGDISMKQSKAMMDDLLSDFKFLANAFHRFRIAFAKSAEPILRVIFKAAIGITDVISSIVESPIGKVLVGIVSVVTPVIGVLFAFRAAALTATLALRTLGLSSAVGGYKGLLGAGLGLVGMSRFNNGAGSGILKNAAGKYIVAPGNPMGMMSASGKLMRGGQFVSGAALTGMGLGAGATAARGVGLLGAIGGLLGRAIPILGGILLGVEVLKALGIISNDREERTTRNTDPLLAEYYKNMDEAYYGRSFGTSNYMQGQKNMPIPNVKAGTFSQTIQINMDGKSAMNNQIQQNLEGGMNRDILFNLAY